MLLGFFLTFPIALLIGYLLMSQTNADFPYVDSMLASMSIWAQLLQTRKKLENWYLWIAVNAVYILLYSQKELYISSLLYAVYLFLAIQGALEWRKVLRFSTKDLP
jgi:nicotinamide mononucleotide transporter